MNNKQKPDNLATSITQDGRIFFHWRGNDYYVRQLYRGKQNRRYFTKTTCYVCGKLIFRQRNNLHRAQAKNGKIRSACNGDCKIKLMSGSNAHQWAGGRIVLKKAGNRVRIYAPDHPAAHRRYVVEHRLEMEKKIGRFLTQVEVVHHIDLDPSNNEIENLSLCHDEHEHRKAHMSLNHCVKELIRRGHLKFDKKSKTYGVPEN